MKGKVNAIFAVSMIAVILVGCVKQDNKKPLACLSLTYMDDSFNHKMAEVFEETMEAKGYQSQVTYCENNIDLQLKQIENFIVQGAELIQVSFAGDTTEYTELLESARSTGCRVIATSNQELSCVDVKTKSYPIMKGAAVCAMVTKYLDQEYPDAAPGEVTVLFLEASTTMNQIENCSGFKLLGEEYLRYYNSETMEFEDLILDDDGNAIENLYYDERVNLQFASNRNVVTNLDAQNAIDSYVNTTGGNDLRIVMCFGTDAGQGANEKLLYYSDKGIVTNDRSKLAVFSSDDAQENLELLVESASNDSVYRGGTAYNSPEVEVPALIELALENHDEIQYYVLQVRIFELNGKKTEVVYEDIEIPWDDPDMFFK